MLTPLLLLVLILVSRLPILGVHDAHVLKEVARQRAPQLPVGLRCERLGSRRR